MIKTSIFCWEPSRGYSWEANWAEKTETRQSREKWKPREGSWSRLKCLIKICTYKGGKPIHPLPSQVSWCPDAKLSAQPFSSKLPNSQVAVNSGKTWRTSSASQQVVGSVTSKEINQVRGAALQVAQLKGAACPSPLSYSLTLALFFPLSPHSLPPPPPMWPWPASTSLPSPSLGLSQPLLLS